MEYAILFSVMGSMILYLLYVIYRTNKRLYVAETLLKAIVERRVEFIDRGDEVEFTFKKEKSHGDL